MRRPALLFVAAALAAGCVSTGKYQASVSEADSWKGKARGLEADLASRSAELDTTRKDVEGVKKELETAKADKAAAGQAWAQVESDLRSRLGAAEEKLQAAETQVTSLKGSVRDLQQASESSKSEMSRKLSSMVTEKDELAQKLAEAQSSAASLRASKDGQISELTRKLTAALEEKGQLEQAKAQAEAARQQVEKAKEDELSKVKQSYEDLASNLKAEIAAGEVKLTQLQGRLTVQLVDRILFDSGSAEIKPAGRKVLSRIGKLLGEVQGRDVRIEGHTDNVPISDELRSIYPSNWELSTARATAVARYLQDAAKIDPKRLIAAGYGEFRPVAPNDKPESRALNRRIELVLIAKE